MSDNGKLLIYLSKCAVAPVRTVHYKLTPFRGVRLASRMASRHAPHDVRKEGKLLI